jgi:hypothetical protein
VDEALVGIAMGRDGLVYGLSVGVVIYAYDPDSLEFIRSLELPFTPGLGYPRGFVVDAASHVFVVNWDGAIYECDSNGEVLRSIDLEQILGFDDGDLRVQNLDLDPFGNLVIGQSYNSPGSSVILNIDTNFDSASSFEVGDIQSPRPRFVTFTSGSAVGANYCSSVPNSTNEAARITATGTHSLALDDLTLEVGPIPNNFYIFYVGPGEARRSFGNGGSLCVGGGMLRYPAHMATDNTGSMSVLPGEVFSPGSVGRFQCWFRDPGVGPDYFNSSDGYVIQFVP